MSIEVSNHMKSEYTRKQIENAIAFWIRQYGIINESCSRVVDELEAEFGHDCVFSKLFEYVLTDKDIIRMFNILNRCIFDSKLKFTEMFYWPERLIVDRLNANNAESGFDRAYSEVDIYGVFSGIAKCEKNNIGKVIDVKIVKPIVMINKDRLKNCIFIFAVSCVCHEMIHYYDSHTNEYVEKSIHSINSGSSFDSHEDIAF